MFGVSDGGSPASRCPFQKVRRGRSGTFSNIPPLRPDGIPRSASAAVISIQTLDFSVASRHMNAAVPSHHPPSPPAPPSPGTTRRTMPGCHHIKRRERGSDGERQRDRCGAADYKHDCASKQNWTGLKKNFLLNWLYIHERRTTAPPSAPPPQPPAAWCQLSTLHQRLHLLAAIEAGPDGPDPRLQFIWGTDNTPKSFINPNIMYSIGTIGFQRANSLENRPDLFSLWSLTACFIFAGITRVDLGGWRWFLGGCLSTYFPH